VRRSVGRGGRHAARSALTDGAAPRHGDGRIDAIAHAGVVGHHAADADVDVFAHRAWHLLEPPSSACCYRPDIEARSAMRLGAHYAGMAIGQSMLGPRTRAPTR
jgi:hypothetical protein